jgi:hypothetical protein
VNFENRIQQMAKFRTDFDHPLDNGSFESHDMTIEICFI